MPGVLRHQYWTSANPNGVSNPSRTQVEAGQAGLPDTDTIDLTAWDTQFGGAVNYAERISGVFIAPITTNYVFWVNSDDDSDLFVSPDASPAHKRLVAQEAGWSNMDNWQATGGGSTLAQKRSDEFSPDGVNKPFAKGIPMVAGQRYWIEGVHHQGGGGENFGATYSYLGGALPVEGAPSALSVSNNVIGYGYTIPTTLTVTTQASNVTAYAGSGAVLTYVVDDPLPDPLVYQWYRNGQVISNATYQQYNLLATAADNNAQFQCVVTIPLSYSNNAASTSVVATLTVNTASLAYTNGVKIERFLNFYRADVENGNMGPADSVRVSTQDGSASPLDFTGFENLLNDNINNYRSG